VGVNAGVASISRLSRHPALPRQGEGAHVWSASRMSNSTDLLLEGEGIGLKTAVHNRAARPGHPGQLTSDHELVRVGLL
jgi:hypothetical protein